MTATFETTSREAEELQALERLWHEPSLEPRPETLRRSSAARRGGSRLVGTLVRSWLFVLAAAFLMAPASNPEVSSPLWTNVVFGLCLAALLAAVVLAVKYRRGAALVCSAFAAGCGVALGISCRATEHHLGSWWLVETVAFAGLLALSLGCLASRRARG